MSWFLVSLNPWLIENLRKSPHWQIAWNRLFWNKAEELQEETWLSEDTDFHLDGIDITNFDRDVAKTRKSIGGGLCIAVTNKWATNFTEKLSLWTYAMVISLTLTSPNHTHLMTITSTAKLQVTTENQYTHYKIHQSLEQRSNWNRAALILWTGTSIQWHMC